MGERKYFVDKRSPSGTVIKIFLALLLLFSVAFFLWSVMRYNEIEEEKGQKQKYVESHQTKKLPCRKGNHQQNERQPMEWEKTFANHTMHKGLISKMWKELM